MILLSALFFGLAHSQGTDAQAEQPGRGTAPAVDRKAIQQIIEAEKRIAVAIQKRDAATLDRLLDADYRHSFEGSERALSKKGALILCASGRLSSYAIERNLKFTRDRGGVKLDGVARRIPNAGAGAEAETDSHTEPAQRWAEVHHWWLKKEKGWVLAEQVVTPIDGEAERER